MDALEVHDPVYVTREARQLEGVISFLGPVSFADGDDWVGVRLTGVSVGLGKNDGSVQGVQYFECPANCGIFVKLSAVSKRQLTRLEELRLRRELAQGLSTTSSSTTSAAVEPPSTPSRNPKTPNSARASRKTASSTTPNRLEEIRQRRAALQGKSSGHDDGPSHDAGNEQELLSQLASLQEKLKSTEAEAESLKEKLARAEKEATEKKDRVEDLEDQLVKAKNAPPPEPVLAKSTSIGDDAHVKNLEAQVGQLNAHVGQLKAQLEQSNEKMAAAARHAKEELEKEQEANKAHLVQLTAAKTEVAVLQEQLTNLADQAEVRGSSDTSHYKERARLQAEVASLNRKVEQYELEKQDMENTIEELTLDKEQIQEEKEALEDHLEELKLDAETAQMEVDELRFELEDAKASTADVDAIPDSSEAGGEMNDAEDMRQTLSVQNARLREAVIRLREQSSVEKMELSRQLRAMEKVAEDAKASASELESLKALKTELEEQVSDLKDMVEQGSAYEVMVEDLSDRVLSLEEELVASQAMIREMEEAADITAEMEEVQTEELKALSRDLEDRESIIRNLEEAIKMQRKREEDFQRTVGNYRSMVDTLKQEKKALLELQQGGEGEKSDLVSASQKALARAAQLVQDAAEMRKREAQAAIDRIDSQVRMHLCERLERLLPPSVAASEIASIKGELLLSKVVGKASLSLDGIARSFQKTIRVRSWEWRTDRGDKAEDRGLEGSLELTDEEQQTAATMIHQSEVAHVAIDVSGDLLWLLSAGQWPDILYPEASAELGAIMGHALSDLDVVLGTVLNTLKEEGVLSPHQSNIGEFRQTVVSTMQTLRSHIEVDGESLVPMDWKPPALRLFRDASRAKYSSLGCYAAVASVLNHVDSAAKSEDGATRTKALTDAVRPLLTKLDKAATEAARSCLRLAHLDVQDEATVGSISAVADSWRSASDDLMGNVYNMLSASEGLTAERLSACETATDEVVKLVSQFAAALRSANLHSVDDNNFHPFSPEVADVWEGVTMLARNVRSADGDADDINCLVRARYVEHFLEDAVDKVPKLALSNAKVASLEKSLSSRSKEIAMQNARIAELEKLLAKTSAQPSPRIKSAEITSAEEMNSLKQENRVLTEALDVVHRQVEEYESEIRFLKDAKSPKVQRTMRTPRRAYADIGDRRGSNDDLQQLSSQASVGAFEAALFRPALQAARRDAAHWKAQSTISSLLELPPLHVPGTPASGGEEKTMDEDNPILHLSSALSSYRMETASVKVIDISKRGKSSRSMLRDMMRKKLAASTLLDASASTARQWLESQGGQEHHVLSSSLDISEKPLLGRVTLFGQGPARTVATVANREDLYRLQLHLVG